MVGSTNEDSDSSDSAPPPLSGDWRRHMIGSNNEDSDSSGSAPPPLMTSPLSHYNNSSDEGDGRASKTTETEPSTSSETDKGYTDEREEEGKDIWKMYDELT